jgi:hypothetical protein
MPSSYLYPDRLYLLSDTYGGHETWDPLKLPDIDARIATDIRSCITGVRREFDIFGGESVTDHVLRTVAKLHDEGGDRVPGTTGVFINYEPRTTQRQNGNSFYLAEIGPQIRVVATPVSALSPIKERVTALYHLPNEDNGLYEAREQFRSSYVVVLLAANHGLKLIEDDPQEKIPDYPSGCRLSYIDRFGNLVLYEHVTENEVVTSVKEVVRKNVEEVYQLYIGTVRCNVLIGTDLAEALPGTLVVYPNDGNIEVVSKWSPDSKWSGIIGKLENSVFEKFRRPKIGTEVSIKPFIRRFKREVTKIEEHPRAPQSALSERLKEQVRKSGYSGYKIAQETGVDEATISRFLAGKGGLSLDNIDKLSAFLRLELVVKT